MKWFQWNTIQEGKIKKCITKRVKMRILSRDIPCSSPFTYLYIGRLLVHSEMSSCRQSFNNPSNTGKVGKEAGKNRIKNADGRKDFRRIDRTQIGDSTSLGVNKIIEAGLPEQPRKDQ